MKYVVSSDWHLDHVTLGLSRFDEVERAAMASAKAAIDHHATYLFLGDLCDPDKNMSPYRAIEVALRIALMLAARGIESHWLSGNHDVIEDGTGATTLTPMRALAAQSGELIFVHEAPSIMAFDDGRPTIATFPFTPISHNYDPTMIAADLYNIPERAIVLGHLSVEGVVPGEETTEMPRGRDVVLPVGMLTQRAAPTLVMNGHYHRRQRTPEGVIIPGSLARLTFGETDNEPGFLLMEW